MDVFYANISLFGVALAFSLAASYHDIRTGEIPDKFTLGLVCAALAMRAGFSLRLGDLGYLADGLAVGGALFAFGALLFYTGGWGGGDAKLIAGIGAALGGLIAPSILDSSLSMFPPVFGIFAALSMVAVPYSLAYAFILAFKSPRAFSLMSERFRKEWLHWAALIALSLALVIILKPYNLLLSLVAASPPLLYAILVFVRSVEQAAMQKEVKISELQEGDLVVEDIFVKGKKVASRRDMDGLSAESLKELKKGKKPSDRVRIKWGIRFAPAFPLAVLLSPFWARIVLMLF